VLWGNGELLEANALGLAKSAKKRLFLSTVPGEPLQTLDERTKEPPKSRIGTASDCCGYVQRLIQNDLTRSTHRNKVKGNIDGNAPWSKSELVARGQGNNTNLNFRQGEAIIRQYQTPYYDLIVEVPLLAKILTSFGTATERGDWSQIISEEFHRTVTHLRRWDTTVQFSQFQMLVYGPGPMYFHDEVDWRPDAAKASDVLVEDGASSYVNDVEGIVLLKDYIPARLYKTIRDCKSAEDLGWNVDEVEWAIIQSKYPGSTPNDARAVEWYQQKFKNADMFNGEGAAVRTAHVLVQEFDDSRVSHHIVRSDQTRDEFMYSRLNVFPAMEDFIIPFHYDIGDGTWHSVRALGHAIYAYVEIFNRLRCKEVDGAMIAASVLLKSSDAASMQKAQLLRINNLAVLPPGLDVASSNIGQGIEATVSVRRDMEQGLNQNIGLLQRAPGQPNPRKSGKQAVMEMQQAASLGKGNINRYYTSFDWLLQKMFYRMVKATKSMPGGPEAVEFKERCLKRGVPLQALMEIDDISAYRSAGAGSSVQALMATETLMEYLSAVPDAGQEEIKRLFVSRLLGTDSMNAICGEVKQSESSQDGWEASMENNALREGGKGKLADGQSNTLHLDTHLGDGEQHVADVQQDAKDHDGMDLEWLQKLAVHLDALGQHAMEHLKAIANDPGRKDKAKEFQKRLMGLGRVLDKVKQHLAEMQQAMQAQQPQGGGAEPADLLKLYDKAPESVKMQIEDAIGKARQPGDLSVPAQKLIDAHIKTQIRAKQAQQNGTLNDIRLAHDLRK